MTLSRLKAARMAGKVPTTVWVLSGKPPSFFGGKTAEIVVRHDQDAASMDWRPVIGLHVALFSATGDAAMVTVMGCIERASPKALSVACDGKAIGVSDDHERILWRAWERLFKCS